MFLWTCWKLCATLVLSCMFVQFFKNITVIWYWQRTWSKVYPSVTNIYSLIFFYQIYSYILYIIQNNNINNNNKLCNTVIVHIYLILQSQILSWLLRSHLPKPRIVTETGRYSTYWSDGFIGSSETHPGGGAQCGDDDEEPQWNHTKRECLSF